VALIGARRPYVAIAISLVLVGISAYLLPKLKISTSRRDLVSTTNALQRRTVEFDEKFGYTNSPVIVVSGGSQESRHKVVDALDEELESVPELKSRVLGRINPEQVAEVLLFSDPKAFEKGLPEGAGPVGAKLEAGIDGWIGVLKESLEQGLEKGVADDAATKDGLGRLGTMFDALSDELAGKSGLTRMRDLAPASDKPIADGIDELGYVSTAGGDLHLVALFPALESDEGFELEPVVKQIRAARDKAVYKAGTTDVRADVTGVPALAVDELNMVQSDLAKTTIASSIAILLTLYWAFRSFRQSLVSFLPLGFGTIVTFGVIQLTLGHLNLVTASFASVLLGIGDFGVHIQTRYSELLRSGMSSKEAMETALLKSGSGLVLATVTTAVAFLTTMATEFTAFAELGLITSIGLVLMLAGAYLLVPPATLLLLGEKPRPAPELPIFTHLESFVKRWPRAILAVAAVSTLTFACFLPQVQFNGRYFDFLPKNTESARALSELSKDVTASPFVANVRATSVEEARDLAVKLRALPTVASVETATDLLGPLDDERMAALKRVVAFLGRPDGDADYAAAAKKPVDKAALQKSLSELNDTLEDVGAVLRSGGRDSAPASAAKAKLANLRKQVDETDAEAIAALQRRAFDILDRAYRSGRAVVARGGYATADLPALFHHRFVSKDGSELALFVHPKGDIWDVPTAEAFYKEVSGISPEASGIATTLSEHPKMIVRGFERSTVLAAIFVIVILFIGFRRPLDVAASALPLVIGAVWMCGSMPPLGLSFNHANIVTLPLLLGLGLEASAHIVHRYRESADENGGIGKLHEVLSGTGSAVFVGTITTVWGFTAMMLADYRAMYWLGLVMTIGKSATLAASLLVIPALLVVFKKVK
jgi:uncharacterized protein